MKILINGESQKTELTQLEEVLAHFVQQDGPYAVAVNEEFVPKGAYSNTTLSEGDSLEILSPMQGG